MLLTEYRIAHPEIRDAILCLQGKEGRDRGGEENEIVFGFLHGWVQMIRAIFCVVSGADRMSLLLLFHYSLLAHGSHLPTDLFEEENRVCLKGIRYGFFFFFRFFLSFFPYFS